jgi:hypothetical protein
MGLSGFILKIITNFKVPCRMVEMVVMTPLIIEQRQGCDPLP